MLYFITYSFRIISRRICPLPRDVTLKSIFSEHAIAEQLQVCLLVVVDGDENDAAVGEELLGDAEASVHKGKPLGMAVRVFPFYIRYLTIIVTEIIVIRKILVSGIVRRVDVDYIDFAGVGVGEGRQRDKIVALNN